MFIPAEALADWLAKDILAAFDDHFPSADPEWKEILQSSVDLSIGLLAKCSASYHDADHTAMVTQAAQDILIGRAQSEPLAETDWVHFILAALFHDIGFCRGICKGDGDRRFVSDECGGYFTPNAGQSDAAFAPYHVDRGMIFVTEHFAEHSRIDAHRLASAISCTRFPPHGPQRELGSEPALLRAADLIGQIGDPLYSRKLTNLFYEMSELGSAEAHRYQRPGDMVSGFREFYRTLVAPVLGPAIAHLEKSKSGQGWVQRLQILLNQADARTMEGGPFPEPKPYAHQVEK